MKTYLLPSGAIPISLRVSGTIGIPQSQLATIFPHMVADMTFGAFHFRVAAKLRRFKDPKLTSGGRGYITLPSDMVRIVGAPIKGEMMVQAAPPHIQAYLDRVEQPFSVPDAAGGFWCRARIDGGNRGHWSANFPTWIAHGFLADGWGGVTVEAEFPGIPPFRGPLGLGVYDDHPKAWLTIPPKIAINGARVDFYVRKATGVEDKEPVRGGRLYWAAFVPPGVAPIAVGEGRIGFSAHGPVDFTIGRSASVASAMAFFGAYLAEGQKTGLGCSFTSTTPRFAREVIDLLLTFGVPEEGIHIKLGIPDTEGVEAAAQDLALSLGVSISPTCSIHLLDGTSHKLPAVTVNVRNGLYFRDTILRVLDWLRSNWKELPGEALMAFALAYLNGDGGVTRNDIGSPAVLSLTSGNEDELRLVADVLDYCFGWPSDRWSAPKAYSIQRRLSRREVLDLLSVGAFRYSMARSRLLVAYEDWLMSTKEGRPFFDELQRLRKTLGVNDVSALVTKGHKCVPYPLIQLAIPVEVPVHAWRPQREVRIAVEQVTGLVCDEMGAKDVLIPHHYLHSYPGGWSLPLVDVQGGGVAVFSIPRSHICNLLFGRSTRLLELSRLWSPDNSPDNYLSSFLARCIRGIREVRAADALVSYADPEVGHSGTIYKATNWSHTGYTRPSVAWEKDGQIYPPRFFRAGGRMTSDEIIVARGYRRRMVRGKHRYVMVLEGDLHIRLSGEDTSAGNNEESGPSPESVGRALESGVASILGGEAPDWKKVAQLSRAASEAAYHMLGGSDWGWVGVWATHMGVNYWWVRSKDTGARVDVLRKWAGEGVDYRLGRMGGVSPSTTGSTSGLGQELMRRALQILEGREAGEEI